MAKKTEVTTIIPMLKTVEQMSRISGIGENKLRELIERGASWSTYRTATATFLPMRQSWTGITAAKCLLV